MWLEDDDRENAKNRVTPNIAIGFVLTDIGHDNICVRLPTLGGKAMTNRPADLLTLCALVTVVFALSFGLAGNVCADEKAKRAATEGDDDNVEAVRLKQLSKLQDALLEGKIDKETYERLVHDLGGGELKSGDTRKETPTRSNPKEKQVAKEEDQTNTVYITAWGKPQDGLQVGLRCAADQCAVQREKPAHIELVVRNLTSDPIKVRYFHKGFRFIVMKTVVTADVGEFGRGGFGPGTETSIRPSETLVTCSFRIGHTCTTDEPADEPLIVVRPLVDPLRHVLLPPGTYQVGCDKPMVIRHGFDQYRLVGSDADLKTGYLDIEVVKSSEE